MKKLSFKELNDDVAKLELLNKVFNLFDSQKY